LTKRRNADIPAAGMSAGVQHRLQISNFVLTALFAAEVLCKLIAVGTPCLHNRLNALDCVIVAATLVEMLLWHYPSLWLVDGR
jgi:hypothetical protein